MKLAWICLLSIMAASAGCHSSGAPEHSTGPRAVSADSLELAYQKPTSVPGTSLTATFTSVEQDSRCGTDVQCVWEGQLVVDVRVEEGTSHTGQVRTLQFSTHQGRVQSAFGYRFELLAERPPHRSGETIPPGSYWLVVRATPMSD
jgi:hypothetical protein